MRVQLLLSALCQAIQLLLPVQLVPVALGQQLGQTAQPTIVPQLGIPTTRPNYLETGRQITSILDRFMSLGYDKRVRPNYGGPPVEVNVTMRILSISSVSEVMMDFTADFYFRQTWHDPRLAFKKLGDIQTLYVGAEVSNKIWLPDTFFGNEKLAYFHEATTPNVFLRIDHSGEVYRSIRLTVTSSCPMNLQYFPMDRQRCTIEAESYGYNVKDIIYKWARKETAVERDKEISLPQFDIVKTVQKYRLEELSSGTYSRLIAEIHFARRMGYYLIQIYIPSSLIVVISWVSFWLHRNASPARVQLGVTTVLTMTTLMSSTNAALPKISYVKSIDIFLGTCFIMVFAALLEYATVGYLGKRIAMRKAHVQHAQSQVQAQIFAQLQAQGAQGDLVPPTGSETEIAAAAAQQAAMAAAAAAAAQESQHQHQYQSQHHHHLHHHHHQQRNLQFGPQELSLNQVSMMMPDEACNQIDAPIPPERRAHHCCASKHQQLCSSLSLPRSGQATSGGSGRAPMATNCGCGHSNVTGGCGNNKSSVLLPPSYAKEPLLQQTAAWQAAQATIGQVQTQAQAPTKQPCGGPNSPASAAVAAAAATFVNLHRRQKGLPPSSNPNFAKFAWMGQQNRSLETIFGVRPSDIDKYSRVVFPVCFVCFQLMYWIVYLHISAFLEFEQQQNQQQ